MKTGLWISLPLLIALDLQAAYTPPTEHIHFIAEHFAEAAQDARYYAMPWPSGDYSAEGWRTLVSVAAARVTVDLAAANGGLLTLGLSKNWKDRWATDLVAYYDRFRIDGGQTENSLLPFSLTGVPLDLPERVCPTRSSRMMYISTMPGGILTN